MQTQQSVDQAMRAAAEAKARQLEAENAALRQEIDRLRSIISGELRQLLRDGNELLSRIEMMERRNALSGMPKIDRSE